MIALTIDGKEVEVEAGRTLLDAARENGINIPTLCYHEALKPYGGIRIEDDVLVRQDGCEDLTRQAFAEV